MDSEIGAATLVVTPAADKNADAATKTTNPAADCTVGLHENRDVDRMFNYS
jgi:hypothetical protein